MKNDSFYPKGEIVFNTRIPKNRKKELLSNLEELDKMTFSMSSSIISEKNDSYEKSSKKKKSKEYKIVNESFDDDDDFYSILENQKIPKMNKKGKKLGKGFNFDKKKKKKKKKKGKKDYKREFNSELVLLQNLELEQDKFVNSLQKKYDQMEASKSSARGIGKFTTDLIQQINTGRTVSMSIVDKIISVKAKIADLEFKERKEFGNKGDKNNKDMSQLASNYLKEMLGAGRKNLSEFSTFGTDSSSDDDVGDLFDSIDESLSEEDTEGTTYNRSEASEKYLEYENDHVKIKVIYHESNPTSDLDEQYDFIAVTQDGTILNDYPLPEKTKLQINRNTGICKDKYGTSYEISFD